MSQSMSKWLAALSLAAGISLVGSVTAATDDSLEIITAVPNYIAGTLTITAANVDSNPRHVVTPKVWFAGAPAAVLSDSINNTTHVAVIVAKLPTPVPTGSFKVELSFGRDRNDDDHTFEVSLGVQGPMGQQGPIGATGPAGPAGPQGPAGADGAGAIVLSRFNDWVSDFTPTEDAWTFFGPTTTVTMVPGDKVIASGSLSLFGTSYSGSRIIQADVCIDYNVGWGPRPLDCNTTAVGTATDNQWFSIASSPATVASFSGTFTVGMCTFTYPGWHFAQVIAKGWIYVTK